MNSSSRLHDLNNNSLSGVKEKCAKLNSSAGGAKLASLGTNDENKQDRKMMFNADVSQGHDFSIDFNNSYQSTGCFYPTNVNPSSFSQTFCNVSSQLAQKCESVDFNNSCSESGATSSSRNNTPDHLKYQHFNGEDNLSSVITDYYNCKSKILFNNFFFFSFRFSCRSFGYTKKLN
jgi:hypothetical protein